eukprot:jgi/Pico_ML_1/53027/g3649.t1
MKLVYFLAVLLGLILSFSPEAWCDQSGAEGDDEFMYLWDKWHSNNDKTCEMSPMKTIPSGKNERMSMKCNLNGPNAMKPSDYDCWSNKASNLKIEKRMNNDKCICIFRNNGNTPIRRAKMEICAKEE